MTLHFVGGKTSDKLSIIKETKKYIVFRCHSNTMRYRYNKETGEFKMELITMLFEECR